MKKSDKLFLNQICITENLNKCVKHKILFRIYTSTTKDMQLELLYPLLSILYLLCKCDKCVTERYLYFWFFLKKRLISTRIAGLNYHFRSNIFNEKKERRYFCFKLQNISLVLWFEWICRKKRILYRIYKSLN
jgi:hypothetical protein